MYNDRGHSTIIQLERRCPMHNRSIPILLIIMFVLSLAVIGCTSLPHTEQEKLLEVKDILALQNTTTSFTFNGEMTVDANLPDYELVTMTTLPLEQTMTLNWVGRAQFSPFRVEAEINIVTTLNGTELDIPFVFIMTDEDMYFAAKALTGEKYIHYNVHSSVPVIPSFHMLTTNMKQSFLNKINQLSTPVSTTASLQLDLAKKDLDPLIQQTLFYDLPLLLDTDKNNKGNANEKAITEFISNLGSQRVNYVDNNEAFFNLLTLPTAKLKWMVNKQQQLTEVSWHVNAIFNDGQRKGSFYVKGEQNYDLINLPVTFTYHIPSKDQLLPLEDFVKLSKMLDK